MKFSVNPLGSGRYDLEIVYHVVTHQPEPDNNLPESTESPLQQHRGRL